MKLTVTNQFISKSKNKTLANQPVATGIKLGRKTIDLNRITTNELVDTIVSTKKLEVSREDLRSVARFVYHRMVNNEYKRAQAEFKKYSPHIKANFTKKANMARQAFDKLGAFGKEYFA